MGSYSHLRIGHLNIDWSKNHLIDHSVLFSNFDFKKVTHYYADNYTEEKPGYSRKLSLCKSRLELIGYTKDFIIKSYNVYNENTNFSFSFELLNELIKKIDITRSVYDEVDGLSENSEFTIKILNIINSNDEYKYLKNSIYEIGELLDNFDSYSILMLFILNNMYMSEEVVWEYYDLIEGGWINENEVDLLLNNNTRFLLITEGSSDTNILRNALEWIYPDIAGFFEFIDMDENYPFTGVGNIVNFYHGLCKIGSNKNIIFIFDNDTMGNKALSNCIDSEHNNIKKISLPNLNDFEKCKTIGPNGESIDNINEKAVSIEMFLDLNYKNNDTPMIRWKSYDEKTDRYQGSLINKDKYTKLFFNASKTKDNSYSLIKLKALLDSIIDVAKIM